MSEVKDILNNGELIKTTIKPGLGRDTRPHRGDFVTIKYSGKLEDETLVIPETEETFGIGECEIVDAIDLSIPFCDLKEVYTIKASPRFCFGKLGLEPNIAPNSVIIFTVELLKSTEPPVYDLLDSQQKLNLADRKRNRGNYFFRRSEYEYALTIYDKALVIIGNDELITPEVLDLKLKLMNNIAVCNLKLENYSSAVNYCDNILKESPYNLKALYRKGRAQLLLGQPQSAVVTFRKILEFEPDSQLAKNEISNAQRELNDSRVRLKKAMNSLYNKDNTEYIGDFKVIPDEYFKKNSHFTKKQMLIGLICLLVSLLIGYSYYSLHNSFGESLTIIPDNTRIDQLTKEDVPADISLDQFNSQTQPLDSQFIVNVKTKEEFDNIINESSINS